jgi:hypothetical protein
VDRSVSFRAIPSIAYYFADLELEILVLLLQFNHIAICFANAMMLSPLPWELGLPGNLTDIPNFQQSTVYI